MSLTPGTRIGPYELDPGFGWTYFWLGLAVEQKSSHEDAIAAFRRASEWMGGMIQVQAALAHTLATVGRGDEAAELLHEIEHPSTPRYIDPYSAGLVHVAFGDRDRALNWLEKAVENMATWLTMFGKCDPRLDPLRADLRFVNLLRPMRLDR